MKDYAAYVSWMTKLRGMYPWVSQLFSRSPPVVCHVREEGKREAHDFMLWWSLVMVLVISWWSVDPDPEGYRRTLIHLRTVKHNGNPPMQCWIWSSTNGQTAWFHGSGVWRSVYLWCTLQVHTMSMALYLLRLSFIHKKNYARFHNFGIYNFTVLIKQICLCF